MGHDSGSIDEQSRRLRAIREEMRFEIGVFHDRINALISAEAFLLISFTMALAYANTSWQGKFFWISPILSAIGFVLAVLAWPGANTSFKIMLEWNVIFLAAVNEAQGTSSVPWRSALFVEGGRPTQADHRRSMLFARWVPVAFMAAWPVLALIVLTSPWR